MDFEKNSDPNFGVPDSNKSSLSGFDSKQAFNNEEVVYDTHDFWNNIPSDNPSWSNPRSSANYILRLHEFAKRHHANLCSKLDKRIKSQLLNELHKFRIFLNSIKSEMDDSRLRKTSFCCNSNGNTVNQSKQTMEVEYHMGKSRSESIQEVGHQNCATNHTTNTVNWQKLPVFQNPTCNQSVDLGTTRENLEVLNRNFIERVNSRFQSANTEDCCEVSCEHDFRKIDSDHKKDETIKLKNLMIGEQLLNFFRKEIIERKNPNVMQLIEQIRNNF